MADPAAFPPAHGLPTSAAPAVWKIPIVLVSYSDSLLRYGPADFERALFDTTGATGTGSFTEYYRWVSNGRLTAIGRVVANVVVPETRAFYGANSYGVNTLGTPRNAYGLVREALRVAGPGIDWSEFDQDRDGYVDMLWLVHAGIGGEASADRNNIWSITSRMSHAWRDGYAYVTDDRVPGSATQFIRIDRFTTLPELSPFDHTRISEIGVYCHEFGHALGLPDLYDTMNAGYPNVGPGNWSLMASGAWGGNGYSPQYPVHLGAWPLQFLGWDDSLRPGNDTTLVLPPVAGTGKVVDWWFQGESSPEHFLIENRQQRSFDRNLPAPGLLIYHVDESVIGQRLRANTINSGPNPGLWVVEADGDSDLVRGRNRGDANDSFPGATGRTRMNDDTQPGTRTFGNAVTQMAIYGIERVGDSMRLGLQVRAPGWHTAEDVSGFDYKPVDSFSPARRSVVSEDGAGHVVNSELRDGIPQVVLRSGLDGWNLPEVLSTSPRGAVEPTVTALPGGDLAVAWSDHRDGIAQLYFRGRVSGVWGPEQPVVRLPGECLSPALAAGTDGTLALAFQHVLAGVPQILLMRFRLGAGFGTPLPITSEADLPGGPALVVTPGGSAWVMWMNRASEPNRWWFSRHHPDSGASVPAPLIPGSLYSQVGMTAACGPGGLLHIVWQVSGPGYSQLYHQSRPGAAETLLESQSGLIQNPVVAVDAENTLHLVFERALGSVMQVRHRSWNSERGWEARSTDVTFPQAHGATRPQPLPTTGGNVTVAFNQYVENGVRFMVRRRQITAPGGLQPAPEPVVTGPRFRFGPTPLRSGAAFEVALDAGATPGARPRLDVFDIGGRRIAALDFSRQGREWLSRISGAVTGEWASGIYFARVSGTDRPPIRVVVIR